MSLLLATCDSWDAHSSRTNIPRSKSCRLQLLAMAPVPLGGNPLATRDHGTRAVFYLRLNHQLGNSIKP